jgi:hypothetical protein
MEVKMRNVNTSREAVEAMVAVLKESDWNHVKVAADFLLALVAERDALIAQRDAAWKQLKILLSKN